jgi:hypothetical protein
MYEETKREELEGKCFSSNLGIRLMKRDTAGWATFTDIWACAVLPVLALSKTPCVLYRIEREVEYVKRVSQNRGVDPSPVTYPNTAVCSALRAALPAPQ